MQYDTRENSRYRPINMCSGCRTVVPKVAVVLVGGSHKSQTLHTLVLVPSAAGFLFSLPSLVLRTSKPFPKRNLQRVRSSAPSFKFQYILFFLRSSSRCLRLLPCLCVPPIFPSITCFRRQFLRKM
jgi:hypothetical protein